VRLDPSNETAHVYLGIALRENAPCGVGRLIEDTFKAVKAGQSKQVDLSAYDCREADFNESISEFREAIRLNPDDEWPHYLLGYTLVLTHNLDAGIEEYGEALRLNRNYAVAHMGLGNALGQKGDLDGAIVETRAAVRLDVKEALFHESLAQWLEKRGDQEEALSEYREAYTLAPLAYEGVYERFLKKVNTAHQQEKLQHWLGTWVFGGPVRMILACGGRALDAFDTTNFLPSFSVLTIGPSGQVGAQVEHPLKAGENKAESIRNPKPDWSGTATETSLEIRPGTWVFLATGRVA
jgi:tetratricopeptide (TPR) repeat protein